MAITITCTDGQNSFSCCDGVTSTDHDFFGVLIDDGTTEQRVINPVQISRKAASVLVWDSAGNYRDILVSEVAAASTVSELAALILVCRGGAGSSGFTREIFTGVSGSITVSETIPGDTSKVVVFVGGIIAKETDHYTISGQQINWAIDNTPDNETIQVFIFA